MSDFETVPVGTMEELKKTKAERDELAADSRDLQLRQSELLTELALVEEERDALASFRYRSAHYVFRYRGGHFDAQALADAMVILDSTKPTTSLDRLIAEEQSVALDAFADWLPSDYEGAEFQAGIDQSRRHAKDHAVRKRRQAEGGH